MTENFELFFNLVEKLKIKFRNFYQEETEAKSASSNCSLTEEGPFFHLQYDKEKPCMMKLKKFIATKKCYRENENMT